MKKIVLCLTLLLFQFAPIYSQVILVLGSGGCRGLAHVGVIEELEKLEIKPDLIIGCSSGAIVGALYAQHQDIAKVKECLIHRTQDDFVDFTLFEKNAISTRDKLEKFLHENLLPKTFKDLQIPLITVATNLQTGKPEYFDEGDLAPAVLSSAALPLIFPPYKMGENTYLDGGICDPLPAYYARSLDKKAIIIASDISCSLDAFDIENLPQVVSKAFEIGYQHLAYLGHKKADILLEMNFTEGTSPIEDGVNEKLYEQGKQTVLKHKEALQKIMNRS